MNVAYVHLITNHIPVIGLAFTILVMVISLVWKSGDLRRLALLMTVLTALGTIPAFFSGEGAEHEIKRLQRNLNVLELHEHHAKSAFWLLEGIGCVALLALIVNRKQGSVPNAIFLLILALNLVAVESLSYVSHLGGRISHPEVGNVQHPTREMNVNKKPAVK